MKLLLPLLLLLFSYTATAQMKWRLVEEVYQEYDSSVFVTKDSTQYIYSYTTDRKGMPDSNLIEYDICKLYETKFGALQFVKEYRQNFYPSGSLSVRKYYNNDLTNNTLAHGSTDSFLYYQGNLTRIHTYRITPDGNIGKHIYRKEYTYNSFGSVTSYITYYNGLINPPYWASGGDRIYYSYDASNRLLVDSPMFLTISYGDQCLAKTNYEYSSTSGYLSDKWRLSINNQLVYDTVGRVNYEYDQSGLLVRSYSAYGYWRNEGDHRYIYNSKGQIIIDSMWGIIGGQYELGKTITYTYNNNDLLATITTTDHTYNRANRTLYTYANYLPNGIEEVAKEELQATVYPNPATNIVSIKAILDGEEEVHGSITDMQGRVLQKWSDKADKNYTKTIHLSQLSSGVYFINLTACNKNVSKQFIVQ